MIFSVFLIVYGGYIIVWFDNIVVEIFGFYVYFISKYKVIVFIFDYFGLKWVVYNYFVELFLIWNYKKGLDLNF